MYVNMQNIKSRRVLNEKQCFFIFCRYVLASNKQPNSTHYIRIKIFDNQNIFIIILPFKMIGVGGEMMIPCVCAFSRFSYVCTFRR